MCTAEPMQVQLVCLMLTGFISGTGSSDEDLEDSDLDIAEASQADRERLEVTERYSDQQQLPGLPEKEAGVRKEASSSEESLLPDAEDAEEGAGKSYISSSKPHGWS